MYATRIESNTAAQQLATWYARAKKSLVQRLNSKHARIYIWQDVQTDSNALISPGMSQACLRDSAVAISAETRTSFSPQTMCTETCPLQRCSLRGGATPDPFHGGAPLYTLVAIQQNMRLGTCCSRRILKATKPTQNDVFRLKSTRDLQRIKQNNLECSQACNCCSHSASASASSLAPASGYLQQQASSSTWTSLASQSLSSSYLIPWSLA